VLLSDRPREALGTLTLDWGNASEEAPDGSGRPATQWRLTLMPFVGTGHIWLLAILLIIVLIIWGPGKLPDIGSGIGRAIREFRNASAETKAEFSKATAPESPAEAAAVTPAVPAATVPVTPGTVAEPAPLGGGPAGRPTEDIAVEDDTGTS
jgi:sec-independent protein translocase protein TatA